uniref:folate gamma-glutamyl hydrolase n=1 Tax=Achlya hypogyna TaxID=1202772 RepID=A0A0A7CND3_ACHHY|nr:secreted protein [Achlya hypogyna]
MLRTLVITVAVVAASVAATSSPIIGVVAQPYWGRDVDYIAASYVKWLESAGARSVAIPYSASNETLHKTFSSINGLLFPGGSAFVSDQAAYLYSLAIDSNDQGVHFPIWGTCLGFEWLLQLTAGARDILDTTLDAMNLSSPLNFTAAASSSRIVSFAPSVFAALADGERTMNNHKKGMSSPRFAAAPALTSFFDVLATSKDRTGVEYVAMIEAKKYPFYGVQFHPEKHAYELGTYADGLPYEAIDHGYEAIAAGQAFSHFFVGEARKNNHSFPTPVAERAALHYNWQTTTHKAPAFVEIYEFPVPSLTTTLHAAMQSLCG